MRKPLFDRNMVLEKFFVDIEKMPHKRRTMKRAIGIATNAMGMEKNPPMEYRMMSAVITG